MSGSSRRRFGFTLVELLVVITIIGTLVALLLPAVQSARESARSTQCRSNLSELAKAAINYATSKDNFPGYIQYVKRGTAYATVNYNGSTQKLYVTTAKMPDMPFSWATMLLSNIERRDIWDQIVDVNLEPTISRVDLFVCPSDSEALSVADRPALTYSANTGAWDMDGRGQFLSGVGKGDVTHNGVLFDLARTKNQTRLPFNDGADKTILFTENIHKSYESETPGQAPLFSWLSPTPQWANGAEQQFGIVWVVNTNPQPGRNVDSQERINGNVEDLVDFDPVVPRFARPASAHSGGVNVAFCDASTRFVPVTIDYIVYQQLLTTNGGKCEDPVQHQPKTASLPANHPIRVFRTAPPVSDEAYQ